ncbi:hypothetical protein PLICRDRAFT_175686 [Plicaturopsis crispa FD-325 SS-3]|nr:hypothetical protein PLICRDRAFT_175686 [Plicaturopsis crispa FD-325 SS-3]
MSKPFGYDDIDKVATAYLQRDKFPTMIIDSDSEDDDTTLSDLSEDTSDSEESDSDSDDERDRRRKKKEKKKTALKKTLKKKRPAKVVDDDDEEDEKPIRRGKNPAQADKQKHEEVEGLIRQLNKMSIDDTEYGATYYKALKIDSDIAKVVRPPQINPPPPTASQQSTKPSYQSSGTFQRQAPPHMMNATSNGNNRGGCFGCGDPSHPIRYCPKINQLVEDGVLKRDAYSRSIQLSDGTYVQRLSEAETIIAAAERIQKEHAAKKVSPPSGQSFFYNAVEIPYDEDTDDEDNKSVFVVPRIVEVRDDEAVVMPAEQLRKGELSEESRIPENL